MLNIEEKRERCKKSLYDFLKAGGDGRFLFSERESYTFSQTRRIAESFAVRLYEAGVRRGDLVALRAERSIATAFAFFALHIVGAVAVMTDGRFPPEQAIAETGVDIAPKFFLSASADGFLLAGQGQEHVLSLHPAEELSAAAEALASSVCVTDPSLLIFTSGSTGKSKGVLLCQRNYIANSVDGGDLFRECPSDVNALVLPLHHIFGIALLVCSTVSGHAVYLPADPSPASVFGAICAGTINILYSVPTYLLQLAELAEGRTEECKNSLRFALIAGGPSTRAQAERIERALQTRLIPVYGMSEYVGISCCAFDDPSSERTDGVGRFYPLNEGFLLGEDGECVGQGEEGEICVRGYDLMLGYYNDPENTAEAIDAEGRLHTGDLGYIDERGILHITGRKKELIIRGGENISAGKIERALSDLEGVAQAVAFPVSDEKWGEVPWAAVVARPGAVLEEETLKAAAKLTSFEMPVRIVVLREFPLTSSGKIDKKAIRAEVEKWKDR